MVGLTKEEKEFLKLVTQQHYDDVEKNIMPNEQFLEFSTQEKYADFLKNLMKKLE